MSLSLSSLPASELHSHCELAICDTPYGPPLARKSEIGSNCETKTESLFSSSITSNAPSNSRNWFSSYEVLGQGSNRLEITVRLNIGNIVILMQKGRCGPTRSYSCTFAEPKAICSASKCLIRATSVLRGNCLTCHCHYFSSHNLSSEIGFSSLSCDAIGSIKEGQSDSFCVCRLWQKEANFNSAHTAGSNPADQLTSGDPYIKDHGSTT